MTANKNANLSACVPVNLLKEPVSGEIARVIFRAANSAYFRQKSSVTGGDDPRAEPS